jgi:hypothetical protein
MHENGMFISFEFHYLPRLVMYLRAPDSTPVISAGLFFLKALLLSTNMGSGKERNTWKQYFIHI